MRWLEIAVVTAVVLTAAVAHADPPPRASGSSASEELRRNLDQVIVLIQSPSFQAETPARRREAIRQISDRLFNWSEMSKRALGSHWTGRSAAERQSFADSFAAVVERAYTGLIDHLGTRRVPADAIRYVGESRDGDDTVVRTTLVYARDLPIDFVMSRRAGRWEVCDFRVDGVSAADNYRAQFGRVISSGSYPGLVERMNGKASGAASP